MSVIGEWSQTVRLGTLTNARVVGLSVREESRAPITEIEFTVEDSPATRTSFDAVKLNQEVEVTHTYKPTGDSRTWIARIVDLRLERGRNYTQARVKAHTLETLAKRRRIFGQYSGTVAEVIEQVWNEWGTWIVSGTNIGDLTEQVEIEPAWSSLFNVLDEIARRYDYAWNVDPVNDELVFFDPLQRTGDTIRQDQQDLIAKSLTIRRNGEDIVNSILASGWIYRDVTGSERVATQGGPFTFPGFFQACQHSIHSKQVERLMGRDEWELVGGRMLEDWGDPPPDREFTIRSSGWVTFDPALVPGAQATEDEIAFNFALTAKWAVRFRKLVQTIVENQESIEKYGRRDGEPVTEDGGQTIVESRQRADVIVNARAWPTLEVDADLTRVGPRPDTVARVVTDDPVLDRNLFVETVEHSVQGAELRVSVSLSSPDPDADVVT